MSLFQSTLPLRGATSKACLVLVPFSEFQSTLPLRGATNVRTVHAVSNRYFNPHSPCGERHMPPFHIGVAELFQSTLPLRGATLAIRDIDCVTGNFNPHSPCGERPNAPLTVGTQTYFNPHSPCGERPFIQSSALRCMKISIHTPLAGSDLQSLWNGIMAVVFQSTLPLRGATPPKTG